MQLDYSIDQCRVRGLSFINKVTGESISTDTMATRLSRMRRRVRSWAESLQGVVHDRRYRTVMVTLTYRDVDGWKPNDIKEFMRRVRRLLGDKLIAYAWVAELQMRGAVHYHLLLVVSRGARIPLPDKAGLWNHGLTRIETARTVYYILKYAGKEYQKIGQYPKGLRMFAVWLSIKAVGAARYFSYRLSALPAWLAEIVCSIADFRFWPRRARDGLGGWLYAGKRYHSPWIVVVH